MADKRMSGLFEALIAIVIALVLFPVVSSFVTTAQINASATSSTLLGLIPLFWVLGAVGLAVGLIYHGFKSK